VEYDAFLPDSPELRANLRSNGPYRVTRYVPGRELRLEPNPAWRQDADPVRHRYLDAVEVVMDRVPPERIAAVIGAGRADLPWGTLPAEPYEQGEKEPDHGLGHALDPYLVLNTRTMPDPDIRRAVAYAIDKAAVAEVYRELRAGTVVRVAGSVVPPGNDAHQDLDPYATPGGRGDPERARDLLAAAGHPDGLALTLVYPDTEAGPGVAQACAAALAKAGITVRPLALDAGAYHRLLRDPARAAAGEWDVAVAARTPDWCHLNGRVFLQAMFQTNPSPGTANHGQYSEPAVDELIDRALAAVEEPGRAVAAWRAAERRVLEDAAVVPILFQTPCAPRLRGARVRDAIPMPAAGHAFDLSAVRLAD
jgi:peptide/nickel transport system substrate-binding protein